MQKNTQYSSIQFTTLPAMNIARYAVVSSSPEQDAFAHMDDWAQQNGLFQTPGYTPRRIGWEFPFVSQEQTDHFGLRGYVAAYLLPDGFTMRNGGAEIVSIGADTYAVLTLAGVRANARDAVRHGYKLLRDYVNAGEYRTQSWVNRLVFEEELVQDGTSSMTLFLPIK